MNSNVQLMLSMTTLGHKHGFMDLYSVINSTTFYYGSHLKGQEVDMYVISYQQKLSNKLSPPPSIFG